MFSNAVGSVINHKKGRNIMVTDSKKVTLLLDEVHLNMLMGSPFAVKFISKIRTPLLKQISTQFKPF